MKMYIYFLILLFSGCTTVLESVTPFQNQPVYKTTKNSAGETVHRQTFTNQQPVINPVYIPELRPAYNSESSLNPIQNTAEQKTDAVPTKSNWVGYAEGASTDGHLHLGIHGGYKINDYLQPRIGTSLFFSGTEMFGGFDLSARLQLPIGELNPFVGLGGYIGDTKKCYYLEGQPQTNTNYVCDKKFLNAGYTEIGLNYKFLEIFWRNYNIHRAGLSIPTDQFFGIGIVFQ